MEKWGLVTELLGLSRSHELLIPQRVREEFLIGSITETDKANIDRVFDLIPVSLNEDLLPYFNFDSRDGAIWVISQASREENSCCVIDEKFGRSVCQTIGVRFTGSIGIIHLMMKEGVLKPADVKDLKARIKKSSFFQDDSLVDSF